ncbi:hypothetical protein CJ179_28085 [Rhodococcus sp. ACS1]|nr:hypothetical protein CJ179_28085 [Rhodococcus sp. ACS1]
MDHNESVGAGPDVLAYDQGAHRLYVAAESGTLTAFDQQDRHFAEIGSGHLADNAHVKQIVGQPFRRRRRLRRPGAGSRSPADGGNSLRTLGSRRL